MSKFYFYYSAMNAGKSAQLLLTAFNYKERGMRTMLFTPSFDTRVSKGYITSRIGLRAQAQIIETDTDIVDLIKQSQKNIKISCVLVDEVQFLSKKHIQQLVSVVDEHHIPVLAYGLRSDFKGECFEGSLYAMLWADHLIELKTICFCGKKAIMNLRLDSDHRVIQDGDQIQVGDQSYLSVCRKHFNDAHQKGSLDSLMSFDYFHESDES